MKRAALIVGVNRYADRLIQPLDWAEPDAVKLAGFLEHKAGFDQVIPLLAADDRRILRIAAELAQALDPGGLFLFFFAGHGVTLNGRHLLLCPEARWNRLEYYREVVPVDLLKDDTGRPDIQRILILDACRSNPLKSRDAAGEGFQGTAVLRDIVTGAAGPSTGPLSILCSCDEGRQALEIPQLKQGLFSCALLEEMQEAIRAGSELRLTDAFKLQLRDRMNRLAAQFGARADQHPWLVNGADEPLVLLGGRAAAVAAPAPPEPIAPRVARVKCPICGRRNAEAETFECKRCGRDYLCDEHFVKAARCCEECAEKLGLERAEAERKAVEEAERRKNPAFATRERPWENSLGMKFVPVPGTEVLFSIWETRVQDYEAFVKATKRDWHKAEFKQGPTHPAVYVSWDDAKAFCQWLTEKERAEDSLASQQAYRLPTDAEWSFAVDLNEPAAGTPRGKDRKIQGMYPWGTQWPPPKGAGNYSPGLQVDDYDYTSPVGSFAANRYGLYDLGGNVWEWCEGFYDGKSGARVLRGASWRVDIPDYLLSSFRNGGTPVGRRDNVGFRVLLAGGVSVQAGNP